MVSISLRGHVRADGTLELRIPTKLSETDVEVTIMLEPVSENDAESTRPAWPEGYFERTFGSLRDNPIAYAPPTDFEVRSELR
jgi:hypothetical protein